MNVTKIGLAALVLCLVALLSGCASDHLAIGAEAVPISVRVTPNTAATPHTLTVDIELSSVAPMGGCKLALFYDVRDLSRYDPYRHLDPDDFLKLNPDLRTTIIPASSTKISLTIELVAGRSIATQVNIIAISESAMRGSGGSGTVPVTVVP